MITLFSPESLKVPTMSWKFSTMYQIYFIILKTSLLLRLVYWPETRLEVDEGQREGGEGEDGLDGGHGVEVCLNPLSDQEDLPHLEHLEEYQENAASPDTVLEN